MVTADISLYSRRFLNAIMVEEGVSIECLEIYALDF